MNDAPFVGRGDELETLTTAVADDDRVSLLPVIGPTGIGKSTLLSQFVGKCRDRDYRVLRYDLKEPSSVDQFLSRLLDHWGDVHPSVVPSNNSNTLRDLTGNIGRSLSKTSGVETSLLGAVLNSFADEGDDGNPDITSKLLELAINTRDASPTTQFILVIDQLDETRIDQVVYDEIARLLREIASDAPYGVTCCVGTRERFYDLTDPDISELELQPFDVSNVRSYLNALGLDATAAARVHDAASGSPYFVERIGQIAADTRSVASVLDDLSTIDSERRLMLEERFLATLNDFTQRLLRETCFLPELRPRPVAHVLEEDITEVEATLRDLQRRSILTRLGSSKGNPVYRLHGLQRDFLRERLAETDRTAQHARAAGYFALELANTRTGSSKELLTEDGIKRHREYMTAGVMFEYHLQQLPSYLDAEERVETIFESVPEQDPSPKDAVRGYFANYRHYSITADELGITPAVDADSIRSALDTRPEATEHAQPLTGAAIRGLRAENSLNHDQTEVLIHLASAAYAAQVVSSTAEREELVKELATQRERLTIEQFPDAPELCKLGRVVIDFFTGTVVDDEDSGSTDVWETIEHEYGVTYNESHVLLDAVRQTITCLFDWAVIEGAMEERDGRSVAVGSHLDEDASIEEYGIEGSLLQNLNSPLFLAYRALQPPTTEELDELSHLWSKLEARFADNGVYFLAALCRDIRKMVVDPITGETTKEHVGLQLMNAISFEKLDVVNHEPAATLVTIVKALEGVAAHDPESKEE
ncbi:AAA family ATPase [Haloferax sp. AS1]|uniref:AAA family ATPase n=1 Tax=Haloferax sp. AS1 TaxID=2562277 RepID=UPI00165FFA28|nr:AAA family ATPase [Haloferax sp. AS1]